MSNTRLKTVYREVLVAIVPVILIALIARMAMGTLSWNEIFAGQSNLEGLYITRSMDLTTVPGERHNLWTEVRNLGNQTWHKSGEDSVYLVSEDKTSPLYTKNSTWLSENKINMFEQEVGPGEIAHFNFTIETNLDFGQHTAKFKFVDEDSEELKGVAAVTWNFFVEEPSWNFEKVSQSESPTITRNQTGTLEARFKNTGNTVWRNHGEHPVVLIAENESGRSPFYTDIRWPGDNVATYLNESFVEPGEEGTFTFEITAPDALGVTRVNLVPEVIDVENINAQTVSFDIAVAESGQAQKFDRQHENKIADSEFLRLISLPVGHGDSYVIITPQKEVLVFDTGHPNRANVVVSALQKLGIDEIDYLILSHPHWDHIGGAPYIMDVYPVKKIYTNGEGYPYETYARLAEYFKGDGSNVEQVAKGDKIAVGDDLEVEILNPESVLTEISENDEEINNNSLVAKLSWQGRSILLSSDIYTATIEKLVSSDLDLDVDVLALPHHGNDGFGDVEKEFIEKTSPEVVIKSSDWRELQAETSAELMEVLMDDEVEFLATAEAGELHFTLPGNSETIDAYSGDIIWSN